MNPDDLEREHAARRAATLFCAIVSAGTLAALFALVGYMVYA